MFETSVLLLYSGIGLILYTFYKWATRNENFFKERGIPYSKPNFIFGNTFRFFFNRIPLSEFVLSLYNAHSTAKISGFFNFMKPVYLIRDPEVFKHMTIKEFDSFEDHEFIIDREVDSFLGNTLFLMKGEKWRDMRATLSPAFTGSKMRLMFELLNECIGDTMQHLRSLQSSENGFPVEMVEIFKRTGIDVISSCAFGLKINSFEDRHNKFFEVGEKVTVPSFKSYVKFVVQRLIPRVMKLFRIEIIDADVKQFFSDMVLSNMESRRKEKIIRPDMIDILMKVRSGELNRQEENENLIDGFAIAPDSNVRKSKTNRVWTDDELVSQSFVFFLAGFDTTHRILTGATYELILNPDVQRKLIDEIHETVRSLSGKSITYEILQKMRYMDMVVCEVLRVRASPVIFDRLCTKNVNLLIDGRVISIRKGSQIWGPVHAYHRDPLVYPEPEKFDPERFNEKKRVNINPAYYIPFGSGPRNCVASRFGLMNVKLILYYLLKDYRLEVNNETQIPMVYKAGIFGRYPEKGLNVNLVPH